MSCAVLQRALRFRVIHHILRLCAVYSCFAASQVQCTCASDALLTCTAEGTEAGYSASVVGYVVVCVLLWDTCRQPLARVYLTTKYSLTVTPLHCCSHMQLPTREAHLVMRTAGTPTGKLLHCTRRILSLQQTLFTKMADVVHETGKLIACLMALLSAILHNANCVIAVATTVH